MTKTKPSCILKPSKEKREKETSREKGIPNKLLKYERRRYGPPKT